MRKLLLLATLGACAGAADREPEIVVRRDSLGIELVESRAPLLSDAQLSAALVAEPALAIGAADGEAQYMLHRVVGASRFEDGSIVVVNGGTAELRFYDSTGRHLHSRGGKGGGPSEFDYILWASRCGDDTVHVLDISATMKVFTAAGDVVRQFLLRLPNSEEPSYNRSCAQDGRLVISGWGHDDEMSAGFHKATTTVWIVDSEGREVASLGEHLGSERIGMVNSAGMLAGTGPHPFGRATVLAAARGLAYVGSGEPYEISVYDDRGELRQLIRAPREDLAVTSELLNRFREERLSALPDARRPAEERFLRELAKVESIPAFTALMVDAAGRLWARRFQGPGDEGERWGIFLPDGSFLGHLSLPNRFRLMEAGVDYVLGVERDELDVEYVRMYELRLGDP
jgi:hypothetical protein